METTEKYWNILQNNNEWQRFSETKASIILTAYGIIISVIYSNSETILPSLTQSKTVLIIAILFAILSLVSIIFSFRCLNPNLKNENPTSVIYFGHIAKNNKDFKEYYSNSKPIIENDESFLEQISEQIFVNSEIAWKKFRRATWSFRAFLASIIILTTDVLIHLIENLK